MAVQTQRFLNGRARFIVFVLLLSAAVYLLAVTPVHTFFQQRAQMNAAEQRYQVISQANKDMTQRTKDLQQDATIAQIARDQYELVPQGSQAYAVMPPPPTANTTQTAAKKKASTWAHVWDDVTFWN